MQASMLAWVVTYLVHSTLLVLGAWLLERRWGDRPERMSAVWKTALVGGFLTATVQTGLGIAPVAGRWDLDPELSSREPEASAGADAVTAPVEAPAAVPTQPMVAAARRSSWPPPSVAVPAAHGMGVGETKVFAAGSPAASDASASRVSAGEPIDAGSTSARTPHEAEAVEAVASPSWPPPTGVGELDEPFLVAFEGSPEREQAVLAGAEPARPSALEPAAWDERTPLLAAAALDALDAELPPASPVEPSPSLWVAIAPWAMIVVGLGSLLGLASVLVAFAALRRQLAGRRRLVEGTLPTLLEGLRRRAGLGRDVRLTVAPRVQVPMAVGVLRPEIVVPVKAAQDLPPAHQESLLAHELAHVLRHDPAWRLAALLVERVFFFQPLNRLASRRVAQAAEYLCDDWAARHTRQPLALASCLTEIATWVARTGPVPATMAGPRSILGRRVQRLLQPARASARPWWLSGALGLPLLAVVAVAPGVGAHAKGGSGKGPERIVVIDEDGRRHEVRPRDGGTIVVQHRDGELVVTSLDERGAERKAAAEDEASPRQARKAAREQERARNEARREARRDLRRAFRAAKARGEAAPSRSEVEAILRKARKADGSGAEREHVELRVVVPGVSLHGHVSIDAEAFEAGLEGALEGLRALEHLEGLEDLGSALEQLERALDAEGLDVVILRHLGDHPELRRALTPEQRRELDAALKRAKRHHEAHDHAARHAGKRGETEARRRHAEREAARARREALREHERMRREAARRELERAHRDRMRRSESELPTVWMPAPEAPLAWSSSAPAPAPTPGSAPRSRRAARTHAAPVASPLPGTPMLPPAPGAAPGAPRMPEPPAPPPRVRRVRIPSTPGAPMPPAAPAAPRAPAAPGTPTAPAAPVAPQPDAGPVVWVSWPPPTTGAQVAHC